MNLMAGVLILFAFRNIRTVFAGNYIGCSVGAIFILACWPTPAAAQSKHSLSSHFPSYEGRVMCGYQGWFRAEGDGSGGGWSHYSEHGSLAPTTLHPDFWPDVSEYETTYPTVLTNADGSTVRVFSSWDQS